jgi:hypothetical protein
VLARNTLVEVESMFVEPVRRTFVGLNGDVVEFRFGSTSTSKS